jgi:hypothetical protein
MKKLIYLPVFLLLLFTSCLEQEDFNQFLENDKNIDIIYPIPNIFTSFITVTYDGVVKYVKFESSCSKSKKDNPPRTETLVRRPNGTDYYIPQHQPDIVESPETYPVSQPIPTIKGMYKTIEVDDKDDLQSNLNHLKQNGTDMRFVKIVSVGYSSFLILYLD